MNGYTCFVSFVVVSDTDKFCMDARKAAVALEKYTYSAWMRAGGGRGATTIGSRWLLNKDHGEGQCVG